jgi:hypothetical protein
MTQFEDDDTEPLSFAPHRVRSAVVARKSKRDRITSAPGAISGHQQDVSIPRMAGLPMDLGVPMDLSEADVSHAAVTSAILDMSAQFLDRARRTHDRHEATRLLAHAKRLKEIPHLPAAQSYLTEPHICEELLVYLRRFRAIGNQGTDDDRDLGLKAGAAAVNAALCLGYWRTRSKVPRRIHEFLSAENVYGAIFEIAKTRKPPALNHLLADYTSAVDVIRRNARNAAEAALRPRNPVFWAWAKFSIENVTYYAYALDDTGAELVTRAKLVLALVNVMLDDIADSVQDAELLELLSAIPVAGLPLDMGLSGGYDGLRKRIIASDRERFLPYVEVIIKAWSQAMGWIRDATAGAFHRLETQLNHDYDRLLTSFRFAAALNQDPIRLFHTPPLELVRLYGAATFSDILTAGQNQAAFYTIDAMTLIKGAPAYYGELRRSGGLELHRKSADFFDSMHQIANSVATFAREIDADDMSNGMFKVANDVLNERTDWALPAHLERFAGPERRDAILRAFALKRKNKDFRNTLDPTTPAYALANQEYAEFASDIEQLIEISGAEDVYFQMWLDQRDAVEELLSASADPSEGQDLLFGNDLVLVTLLVYKGRI